MKILVQIVLGFVLCGAVFAAGGKSLSSSDTAPKKEPTMEKEFNQVGRYQLFQGKYGHTDVVNVNFEKQEGLFLLDTATGILYLCEETLLTTGDPNGNYLAKRTCKLFDYEQELPAEEIQKQRIRNKNKL